MEEKSSDKHGGTWPRQAFRNRGPRGSYLTFFSLNLFLWRHLLAISDRLLRDIFGLLFKISYFSVRHKSHLSEPHEYLLERAWICHLIVNAARSSFSSQTYWESFVLFLCAAFLKLWVWFARRCLNEGSEQPMYSLAALSHSTGMSKKKENFTFFKIFSDVFIGFPSGFF